MRNSGGRGVSRKRILCREKGGFVRKCLLGSPAKRGARWRSSKLQEKRVQALERRKSEKKNVEEIAREEGENGGGDFLGLVFVPV